MPAIPQQDVSERWKPARPSTGLLDLLNKWQPLNEDFPEIKDKPAEPEDIVRRATC